MGKYVFFTSIELFLDFSLPNVASFLVSPREGLFRWFLRYPTKERILFRAVILQVKTLKPPIVHKNVN